MDPALPGVVPAGWAGGLAEERIPCSVAGTGANLGGYIRQSGLKAKVGRN
jgi:hypothetical protein